MWQSMSPGMRNIPAALISLFAGSVADPTEVILSPAIPTQKSPSLIAAPSNRRTLFIDRSIIRVTSHPLLLRLGSLVRANQGEAIATALEWQTNSGWSWAHT